MKIILKKPLWFTIITTLCLVVVILFAASSCDKTEILPKYYTVNFVGEGVSIEPQTIVHGNYATIPENPEREGFGFSGWFTDNGTFVNEWDFNTYIVIQDTTLYAKWEETITKDFYVTSEIRIEPCGYYPLFEDRGSPYHLHGAFVWTENLPKEYQVNLLPVTVTFYYTGEICSSYRVINIIKIQKQ